MDEIVEAINDLRTKIGGGFNAYGRLEDGIITRIENALETLGKEVSDKTIRLSLPTNATNDS